MAEDYSKAADSQPTTSLPGGNLTSGQVGIGPSNIQLVDPEYSVVTIMVPASKRLALIPSSEELPFELNGTVALDDYIVFHDGKLSDFLNSTTMAAVIEADNNRTTSGETELEQMMRIRKSILEEEVEEDEEVIKFEIESKDGGELTSRLGEFRKKKIPNPFFLFRQFLVTCVARYNGMLPATRISEYSRVLWNEFKHRHLFLFSRLYKTLKSGHDVIKDAYLKDKKQEKKKARKQSNASTAKKDAVKRPAKRQKRESTSVARPRGKSTSTSRITNRAIQKSAIQPEVYAINSAIVTVGSSSSVNKAAPDATTIVSPTLQLASGNPADINFLQSLISGPVSNPLSANTDRQSTSSAAPAQTNDFDLSLFLNTNLSSNVASSPNTETATPTTNSRQMYPAAHSLSNPYLQLSQQSQQVLYAFNQPQKQQAQQTHQLHQQHHLLQQQQQQQQQIQQQIQQMHQLQYGHRHQHQHQNQQLQPQQYSIQHTLTQPSTFLPVASNSMWPGIPASVALGTASDIPQITCFNDLGNISFTLASQAPAVTAPHLPQQPMLTQQSSTDTYELANIAGSSLDTTQGLLGLFPSIPNIDAGGGNDQSIPYAYGAANAQGSSRQSQSQNESRKSE